MEQMNGYSDLVEMEMEVADNFEDMKAIKPGVFVSFKYTQTHGSGTPFRPIVSNSRLVQDNH